MVFWLLAHGFGFLVRFNSNLVWFSSFASIDICEQLHLFFFFRIFAHYQCRNMSNLIAMNEKRVDCGTVDFLVNQSISFAIKIIKRKKRNRRRTRAQNQSKIYHINRQKKESGERYRQYVHICIESLVFFSSSSICLLNVLMVDDRRRFVCIWLSYLDFEFLFALAKIWNLISSACCPVDPQHFGGFFSSYFWLFVLDLWEWMAFNRGLTFKIGLWRCESLPLPPPPSPLLLLLDLCIYVYKCGNVLRCFLLLIRIHFNGG